MSTVVVGLLKIKWFAKQVFYFTSNNSSIPQVKQNFVTASQHQTRIVLSGPSRHS